MSKTIADYKSERAKLVKQIEVLERMPSGERLRHTSELGNGRGSSAWAQDVGAMRHEITQHEAAIEAISSAVEGANEETAVKAQAAVKLHQTGKGAKDLLVEVGTYVGDILDTQGIKVAETTIQMSSGADGASWAEIDPATVRVPEEGFQLMVTKKVVGG